MSRLRLPLRGLVPWLTGRSPRLLAVGILATRLLAVGILATRLLAVGILATRLLGVGMLTRGAVSV